MKVLIIGLDGFTWKTLEYLKGKVTMTNLEKLRDKSAWSILESTVPPVTIPAWISFATGTNPGKHGVFEFLKPSHGFDSLTPISSRDIKVPTLAQNINNGGLRSIWINLPASTPALTKDITLGSFIGKMGDDFFPKDLKKNAIIAGYKVASELVADKESKEYIEDLLKVSKSRFEAAKELFSCEWDCFFVLFSSTDSIQHLAYDQIKSENYEKFEKEITNIYRAIDDYLAWFMENSSEDTWIILMSDHGFEHYKYSFSINEFLRDNGYLHMTEGKQFITEFNEKVEDKKRKQGIALNVSTLVNKARGMPQVAELLRKAYFLLRRIIPIERLIRIEGHSKLPEVKKSMACSLTATSYGVYLNKKRKYDTGLVEYKDEEKIKEKILHLLRNEKSPFTGRNPFAEISLSSNVYFGEHVGEGPDIVMQLKDHVVNMSTSSGKIYRQTNFNFHDQNGIFLINGPGVKAGRLPEKSIMDIAPTVLHLLGLGVPAYMDGKPILDAFEEGSDIRKREVRYTKEIADPKFSEKMKKLKLGLKKKAA